MVRYARVSNGPQVDGIGVSKSVDPVGGHHHPVGQVPLTGPGILDGLESEVPGHLSRAAQHAQAFGDDLGTYAIPRDDRDAVAVHHLSPTRDRSPGGRMTMAHASVDGGRLLLLSGKGAKFPSTSPQILRAECVDGNTPS